MTISPLFLAAGSCPEPTCPDISEPQARALSNDIYTEGTNEEGVLMASTSFFVLDAGDAPRKLYEFIKNMSYKV